MGSGTKPRVATEVVDFQADHDSRRTRVPDPTPVQPNEASSASNNEYKTSPTSDLDTETLPTRNQSKPPSLPSSIQNLPEEIRSLLDGSFAGAPLPASLSDPPTPPLPLLDMKLQWKGDWFDGWEPQWGHVQPTEENIGKVAKPFLRFCGIDPDNFSVSPFRQGMWNKLYLIKSTDKATLVTTKRIFRIPIPVNPWFKIQSEVATMEYARLNTSIPIPKVYVFDSSMENDLGFEWMIMEKIDGQAFEDVQHSMSQVSKERLNVTIADWINDLSKLQFDAIGSLYRQWDPTKDNYLDFRLGPVTTDCFLGPWRTERPVFKGPFRNEAELYRAVVILNLQDVLDPAQKRRAKRAWASRDGYELISHHDIHDEIRVTSSSSTVYFDEESFQRSGVQQACFAMLDVLPLIERRLEKAPRKYILHHFDISKHNVLLNSDCDAIALLDWENIVTKSLFQVEPWPSIIDSTRYDPPDPWQEGTPKPDWYLATENDYLTRLAADVFMLRLKKLQSPWPQVDTTSEERDCISEFEEDLKELGAVAEMIYAKWGETEICSNIRKHCSDVFLPIAAKVPSVNVTDEHQASTVHGSLFRLLNPLECLGQSNHRKSNIRKRSGHDDTGSFEKRSRFDLR